MDVTDELVAAFQEKVWEFYWEQGRDLPWRHEPTPYEVLVSEVMLQQTQVSRVLVKYAAWMRRFPSLEALAGARVAEVLEEWQGMGYNRRALWLQRAAQVVVTEYGGVVPSDPAELVKLPGIGPNTAGSVAAFAYEVPVVFIETNIRRVFLHEFFEDRDGVSDGELRPYIEAAVDREHPREWYYALMDYGADLAKRVVNPNRRSKHYAVKSKFEGSVRQLRGEVLRRLVAGPMSGAALRVAVADLPQVGGLEAVLAALVKEGFLVVAEGRYGLRE